MLLSEVHSDVEGTFCSTVWTQVSGSGDLLTVLVSPPSSEDEQNPTVLTVRVRVTNTSGFKIPAFTIGIVLLTADRHTSSVSSAAASVLRAVQSGGSDTIIDATGLIEYMRSGAMVEKSFFIDVRYFSSVDVVVRLSYPDLAVEEADSGDAFFSSNKISPSATGSDFESPRGVVSRAEVITAVTDCAPLHISVSALLVPYGQGALPSLHIPKGDLYNRHTVAATMRGVVSGSERKTGVSREIFTSLWDRLSHSASFPCPSTFPSSSSSSLSYLKGSRVHPSPWIAHTEYDRHSDTDTDTDAAWALQTLWGSSIAVRVDVVGVTRRVSIRCSDSDTLSALLEDSTGWLTDL